MYPKDWTKKWMEVAICEKCLQNHKKDFIRDDPRKGHSWTWKALQSEWNTYMAISIRNRIEVVSSAFLGCIVWSVFINEERIKFAWWHVFSRLESDCRWWQLIVGSFFSYWSRLSLMQYLKSNGPKTGCYAAKPNAKRTADKPNISLAAKCVQSCPAAMLAA